MGYFCGLLTIPELYHLCRLLVVVRVNKKKMRIDFFYLDTKYKSFIFRLVCKLAKLRSHLHFLLLSHCVACEHRSANICMYTWTFNYLSATRRAVLCGRKLPSWNFPPGQKEYNTKTCQDN